MIKDGIGRRQLTLLEPVLIQREFGFGSPAGRVPTGFSDVLLWHRILVVKADAVAVLPTEADITLDHEAVFLDTTAGAVHQLLAG